MLDFLIYLAKFAVLTGVLGLVAGLTVGYLADRFTR